jgi:hypothetical protein
MIRLGGESILSWFGWAENRYYHDSARRRIDTIMIRLGRKSILSWFKKKKSRKSIYLKKVWWVPLPNEIADLSTYHLTAWVDGQDLHGHWQLRSIYNQADTPSKLETRLPLQTMPLFHVRYIWSQHHSASEPSKHNAASDLQSLLEVVPRQCQPYSHLSRQWIMHYGQIW